MRRRTGRQIAGVSFAGTAGCIVCAFFAAPALPLIAGAVALGNGLYWYNRLYLEDPEAVAEYREKIASRPLSTTIGEFGADMFKIVGVDDVREYFVREMGEQPLLSQVVALYSDSHMQILHDRGVLLETVLGEGLRLDMKAAGTFTPLWHSLKGRLPSLTKMGVPVDHDKLRQMLLDEFAWVDEAGGLATAAAPDTTLSPAGSPVGVWPAVHSYHRYVVERLNVSKSFLATVLRTCPFADEANMKALVQNHLVSLHGAGLIEQRWVQHKFDQEVAQRQLGLDLWQAESEFSIGELLRERLIYSASAQELFTRAVPTSPSLSATGWTDKRSNIIDFADYWSSTLRQFPELLPWHYADAMAQACNNYRQVCRDVSASLARLPRKTKEEKQRYETEERRGNEAKRQAKARAQEGFVRTVRGAPGGFYGGHYSDWSSFHTGLGNVHGQFNVNVCPQQ